MTIERPMFPPVDLTRRKFLSVAAGAAVVGIPTSTAAAKPPVSQNSASNDVEKRDMPVDPAFALIAEKLAADIAHCEAIDAQDEADTCYGFRSEAAAEAADNCAAAGHAVNEVDWKLANTPPTTLAGVTAVLRFANEIEDAGNEWPNTDTVGPDGWHYQLRATMAAAIEALIRKAQS
jgi:hypothetical protein